MHYLTWITNNLSMWICASVFMNMFKCCGYLYICICVYINVFSYLVLFILKLSFLLLLLFLEFTPFSHFCSDLRDHNKNKAFLPVLHYLSQCWCYWSVCSNFSTSAFIFYLLTNLFVCLFFLCRLIFWFHKFWNFSTFIWFPLACIYCKIKLTYLLR